ncbi:REH1 [[Candida] subhashii]|uniref:REH1 n=1 Tax=[Candida] subhashii TaxID=561895 RepID=A0A8J5QGC5_9ASCO|nr:REH1 [[Candida] subhashii]KAG7660960.1 REH1 [[Candida] subhashii]
MSNYMPQGSNPETASFTCNTCGIKFINAELQRQHMKTEWHRYNLKRRVAQLPSISSDTFAEKILHSRQFELGGGSGDSRGENEDEYGFYVATRKKKLHGGQRQLTKKFLKLQSRKLEQGSTNSEGQEADNEDDEDEGQKPFTGSNSVISEFSQFSLDDHHDTHSEIGSVDTGSEINYTESDFTDLEGEMLSSEEEEDGYVYDDDEENDYSDNDDSMEEIKAIPNTHCFFCDQNNHEIENNIKHMFNRHGLYIPERSFLINVEGFLNYLSEVISVDNECLVCGFVGRSLESIRQHITSKGHCKIPYETKQDKLALAEFYDFIDESSSTRRKSTTDKHVGFSEDPSSSAIIVEYAASEDLDDASEDMDDNGINKNYSLVQIDRSGVELTTPSGSRIGHRSMARYYRQNIALPREYSQGQQTQALVDRRFAATELSSYQVTKEEKAIRRVELRLKNENERRTKSTKVNFQKHFRDEMLQ